MKGLRVPILLAAIWCSLAGYPANAQTDPSSSGESQSELAMIAMRGLTLVDPARGADAAEMTILIEGDRIAAIFRNGQQSLPAGTKVHDLKGRFVLPGLINSHVHLTQRFLSSREEMNSELERMLLGGVVAVRDMAGDARIIAGARRSILVGEQLGPDIYHAAVFGGPEFAARDPRMAQSSVGYRPGESPWAQAVTTETNIPLAIARADGAQVMALKIYLGFEAGMIGRLTEEAHRQGLQVWAHSTVYPARPIDVVRAGVDVISHACGLAWQDADLDPRPFAAANVRQRPRFDPSLVDADGSEMAMLFEEMVSRKVILDPTLSIHARPGDDRFGCTTDLMVALIREAHRAGVTISTGTDWFSPLDDPVPTVITEIEALVGHGVLTPIEALTAATLHGARTLGREDDYGTIEPGKLASLMVLREDPTRDLAALRSVVAVMQRGKLHWRNKPGSAD